MREFLFRGQTRRKGEKVRMDGSPVASNWVYGGVLKGIGDHSIIYQTEPEFHKFPVYTDTLGQFTGLFDKDGTKIFEGDIVYVPDEEEAGVVAWDDESARFTIELTGLLIDFDNYSAIYTEVIGNIYDDPELLGGEEDENS